MSHSPEHLQAKGSTALNGTIVEIYAQVAVIRPVKCDDGREELLEATLFDLKESKSVDVTMFDLSVMFPMGTRVCCWTVDAESVQPYFGPPSINRNYNGPKVLKMELLLDQPPDPKLAQECRISSAYGTIGWTNNESDEGEINVDGHGKLKFKKYATMPDTDTRNRYDCMPLKDQMPSQRAVFVRLYMGGPLNADITIASVEPLGKLYMGEGVITEVNQQRFATIMSYSYGEIFMPMSSYRPPRGYSREQCISHLVGLKVRFTISHSVPNKPTRWRAVRVEGIF